MALEVFEPGGLGRGGETDGEKAGLLLRHPSWSHGITWPLQGIKEIQISDICILTPTMNDSSFQSEMQMFL